MKISAPFYEFHNKIASFSAPFSAPKEHFKNSSLKFNSYLSKDTINFQGQNKNEAQLPDEFLEYINDCTPEDFLKKRIKKENLLGEGRNSRVYSIPEIPDYIIKKLKPNAHDNIEVGIFPGVNLGQAVWQSSKDPELYILKRQRGNEHSVPEWSRIMGNPDIKLDRAQALKFHYDISKLALFEDSAYEKFAKTVQILDENGYKTDSLNANNLLIDYPNHEFNIVDYYKIQDWDENRDNQKNSYLDMFAIISDFSLLDEYLSLLTPDEQEELKENLSIIHKKTYEAAVKTGLSTDVKRFEIFTKHVDKYISAPRTSYYAQYLKLRGLISDIK